MDEINVYFDALTPETVEVAKKLRSWETEKVRVWLSREVLNTCSDEPLKKQWVCGRSTKIIENGIQMDHRVEYWEWNQSSERLAISIASNKGLAVLINRCRCQDMAFVVFGGIKRPKGRLYAFVDASHDEELPNDWISCHWYSTYEDLKEFCRQKGVYDFDLNNTFLYRKTGKVVQGKPVYCERDTGRFLYEDNFHHTHYEVYDRVGRHLGEMSLKGELDRSKADPTKRYLP